MDDAVRELARDVGVASDWIDAADRPQHVAIEPLRAVLSALGFACATSADIAESRARLHELSEKPPPLVTATTQVPTDLHGCGVESDRAAELLLESGSTLPVTLWTT
ncbi:MAG: 4-alpha-glucanotransferase, partial [Paraburkholderia sp.]|nr:4-alpha-glucanotransferase [Paraburkholderia sp.]